MLSTVYVLSERDNARETIQDAMFGYDAPLYRQSISAGEIDNLVEEEWENVWSEGLDFEEGNAFSTILGVKLAFNAQNNRRHIVEITPDDVRDALLDTFS